MGTRIFYRHAGQCPNLAFSFPLMAPLRPSSELATRLLIYTLLLGELLLFTWYRGAWGVYLSPVALYLTGVGACVASYFFLRYRTWPAADAAAPVAGPSWARGLALLAAAGVGMAITTGRMQNFVRDYSISISYSDVIPALRIFVTRWLVGTEVYVPLTWEMGYLNMPTYLPATWFPFVLAERLGLDYRYMAWLLFLVLAGGSYLWVLWRLRRAWATTLVLALLPFVAIYCMQRTDSASFGYTVETMIIGYYALLVAGILLRSGPLLVVALVACLLSRFSLVFWVPLFFGLLFFQDSKRRALWLAGGVAMGVVVFYLVPFLSHDWGMFLRVQDSYTNAALGEWQHVNEAGQPVHLYNGVGLAPFFYEHGTRSVLDKLLLLKKVHLIASVGVVVLAALVYWRQRGRRMDYRLYAILALKLYLATFYALVQVPYTYLAMVSVFISVYMVLMVAGAAPLAASAGVAAPRRA